MIKIVQSNYYDSPRDWDNLCTMWIWHPKYKLGDKKPFDYIKKFDDILEYLDEKYGEDNYYYKPLDIYEQSSVSVSMSEQDIDDDTFDPTCCGIIFVTKDKITKEFGNDANLDKAIEWFNHEIECYFSYLTGEVYDVIDSRNILRPFNKEDKLIGCDIITKYGIVFTINEQTPTGIFIKSSNITNELFVNYPYKEISYKDLENNFKFYPTNESCNTIDFNEDITLHGIYGYKEAKNYIKEMNCLDYLEE